MLAMRRSECVIVALFLSLLALSGGSGAVSSVGTVGTALPLGARQARTQPIAKILYYESEPRWEVKYLLQAVADDERLQVSLLQGSEENGFFVQGDDAPDDLQAGFPATGEELGRYRILILGSVEANAFSDTQLQLIVEFVEAGGSLLMLAGSRSFGEGGWADTAIADLLPVEITPPAPRPAPPAVVKVQVSPTPLGLTHPATQIGAEPWRNTATLRRAAAPERRKPDRTGERDRTDATRRREPRGQHNGAGLSALSLGHGPGADGAGLLDMADAPGHHSRPRPGVYELLAADPPLVGRFRSKLERMRQRKAWLEHGLNASTQFRITWDAHVGVIVLRERHTRAIRTPERQSIW